MDSEQCWESFKASAAAKGANVDDPAIELIFTPQQLKKLMAQVHAHGVEHGKRLEGIKNAIDNIFNLFRGGR